MVQIAEHCSGDPIIFGAHGGFGKAGEIHVRRVCLCIGDGEGDRLGADRREQLLENAARQKIAGEDSRGDQGNDADDFFLHIIIRQ